MSAPTIPSQRPPIEEMVVIHKAFRREFGLLPALVRAVPAGDVRRAKVVAGHARLVLSGLHMHHTGEDALLWPLLLERAAPSAELIERMQAQHERVEELTDRLAPLFDEWTARPGGLTAAELATTLEELRVALVEHLDAEEAGVLPLAGRHLSPAEWNAVGEHGRGAMPARQLPLLFGAILEDADPSERSLMLRTVPTPIRLLVRTVGAWQYRRYVSQVRRRH